MSVHEAARRWKARRGYPTPWIPLPWRVRLWIAKHVYDAGVAVARRICRGNRYGAHTPYYDARNQMGGPCLCERVSRLLDYIPF